MKRRLTIEIECGELRCASDGTWCKHATNGGCLLFGKPLRDPDGWLMRCDECVAAESEVVNYGFAHPKTCVRYRCCGAITLVTGPARTVVEVGYDSAGTAYVPADFPVPTCSLCGEQYWSGEMDAAMEKWLAECAVTKAGQ